MQQFLGQTDFTNLEFSHQHEDISMFRHKEGGEFFPIIHVTTHELIAMDYQGHLMDAVAGVQVSESNGQGNYLLSVPFEHLGDLKFFTDEEASQILECEDADERLLSYAR